MLIILYFDVFSRHRTSLEIHDANPPKCAHFRAGRLDTHWDCYACRHGKKCRYLDPCTRGEDCEICQNVSQEVRESWKPKKPYSGRVLFSLVFP